MPQFRYDFEVDSSTQSPECELFWIEPALMKTTMQPLPGRALRLLHPFVSLCIGLALICLAEPSASCSQTAPPSVRYRVGYQLAEGQLAALTVTADFEAASGSIYSFKFLSSRPYSTKNLTVIGGTVTSEPNAPIVSVHATGASVTIRYVLTASGEGGTSVSGQDGMIRPGIFALASEEALLLPDARNARVSVSFDKPPAGWVVMPVSGNAMSSDEAADLFLFGGRDVTFIERDLDGAPLRLYFPKTLEHRAPGVISTSARVITAERRFWNEPEEAFNEALLAPSDDEDFSGRGFRGAFTLYLGAKVPEAVWLRLIAHEFLHTWISRKIGGFPASDSDLEAWLNEGFTEAYTARILLSAGIWSVADFVADWNTSLARYDLSPVKTAPNSRILADRQKDFDVNKLPYDRGRLLAVLWDGRLKATTNGKVGLTEVLRAQIAAARVDRQKGIRRSADILFLRTVKRLSGIDLTEATAKYVRDGSEIRLPETSFGACVAVVTESQPIFDRGFDLPATIRAHGHVSGLEAGGPAEKAGLRQGEKIFIDETPSHDSRVRLSYTVDLGSGVRSTVSYMPQGLSTVKFQELRLLMDGKHFSKRCLVGLTRP